MRHGENAVITGNAIIVWDGITKPETTKNGQPLPKPKYSFKLALQPNDSSVQEIDAIAKQALQASKFKGVMPHGGSWPLSPCNPQIADGVLNGLIAINPKTEDSGITQKVWDANGQLLNPMTYARMLYPGAIVQVLVHAFAFDNVQKGVALGLDGIRIVNAQAPQLNIGASMSTAEVESAFAAAPVVGAPQAGAPLPGVPGAPAPQMVYGVPTTPPAGYPAPGAPMPPVTGPITPAPEFLTPGVGVGAGAPPMPPAAPVHQMTAKAGGMTYEQFKANPAWTDELLRSEGYML